MNPVASVYGTVHVILVPSFLSFLYCQKFGWEVSFVLEKEE